MQFKSIISRVEVLPAERIIWNLTLFLVIINLIQIFWRDINIDWSSYGGVAAIAAGCFVLGQFYRVSGRSPRIGLALICTGLFTLFSSMMVVFNYLLMPVVTSPIDVSLVWLDSLFGFHWPSAMVWAANNPIINTVLRIVYMTTMPQIIMIIILLGLTGRAKELHVIMVSMTITSVIAIVFWGYFPTHGAKSLFTLPDGIEALANPIVTLEYGQDLLRMAAEGPGFITPSEIKGLIAFPSYHIVLACTAVYAMRNVKWVFPVFVVINLLMLPATPLHGGHHMVDIFGGIALFVFGTHLAEKMVRKMYRENGSAERLESDLRPAGQATA